MAGAYENPKFIDHSQSIRVISAGIGKFVDITKTQMAFDEMDRKEKEKANKVMNKGISEGKVDMEKARLEFETELGGFTSQLKTRDEEGKTTQSSDAVTFETQLEGIFTEMGRKANEEIEEIQKRGGGLDEIRKVKNDAIIQMNKITDDVANWSAAYAEYDIAITKAPNQEGALLRNQTNSQLINMFDAASDQEKGNLRMVLGDNGHLVVSLGNMSEDADGNQEWNTSSVVDLTSWSSKSAKNKSYFEEVEGFSDKDYGVLENTIKDLKKQKRFLDKRGNLDGELVKDYLMNDPVGRTLMNDYTMDPIQARGQWRMLASPSEAQGLTKSNEWGTYDEGFSDDAFLGKLIDNTLDIYYRDEEILQSESETIEVEEIENASISANIGAAGAQAGLNVFK